MSNTFDEPLRPCHLLRRKHRRETYAGLIRPTKLCFTWANEMELAQGKCSQAYARSGLFIASLRARFSISVCDLRARELGSVLMVVGIRQKTFTNT